MNNFNNSLYGSVFALYEAARKVSKAKALKPIEKTLEAAMGRAFRAQAKAFSKEFEKIRDAWPEPQQEALQRYFREAIDDGDLAPLFDDALAEVLKLFEQPLTQAVIAGLSTGALALIGELSLGISFDLKNPRAVEYLKAHGAELVRKIDEETRGQIQHIVTYATEHGWSYNKTAQAIQRQFKDYYAPDGENTWWNFDAPRAQGHIASRSHLIAVTESGNAYEEGNYEVVDGLLGDGINVEKMWSTMGDDRVSEGCLENQAEGWISADQPHASGDMHPLRFPGCRCDELYWVVEQAK